MSKYGEDAAHRHRHRHSPYAYLFLSTLIAEHIAFFAEMNQKSNHLSLGIELEF
jgi:hypothetical protein